MDLILSPRRLKGEVDVPSSKSMAHRYLICAALSPGESIVENITVSADILATIRGVEALGAKVSLQGRKALVTGGRPLSGPVTIDCGESGSTLRFLIPIALALSGGHPVTFTGQGRLMERPLDPYFTLFDQKGIAYQKEGSSLTVEGALPAGDYPLSGKVSSQFITGLLLALSLNKAPASVTITDSLESRPYVDMTLSAMAAFGVRAREEKNAFLLPGDSSFRPACCAVEGDYSQAAFFYGMNAFGAEITARGMREDSLQGDKAALPLIQRMGEKGPLTIDLSQIPDLAPILAVCAGGRKDGVTRFVGAGRLRIKESDRIATTAALLRALSVRVEEEEEAFTVFGRETFSPQKAVDCFNDHRIAMAAAAAALKCESPLLLQGAQCVSKSYPAFWEDYRRLGGKAEEIPKDRQ